MALRPSTTNRQNSSKLSAPGSRQPMPMIAKGIDAISRVLCMMKIS